MIRIKKIGEFNEWEGDFMDMLKDQQYVVEEYEYSQIKKVRTGDLLEITHYNNGEKETFTGICSHYTITYRQHYAYQSGRRARTTRRQYKILYRLTDEGIQLIKEALVTERI